jgi:hypothetical protein
MKSSRQIRFHIFAFYGLLFVSHPVAAYMPLNTDDAGTTTKGGYQVEQFYYSLIQVGQSADNSAVASSGEDYQGSGNAQAFPFTFSRGLTDNIDLQFAPTYYLQPTGSYSRIANYTLNLKWRFYGDGETGLNLALRPQLIAPASASQQEAGIGNARFNYGLNFIASQFGENYELHFNAGYSRAPYNSAYPVGQSTDARRTDLYAVSLAPVWVISPQWKLALDAGVNTNPSATDLSLTRYGLVALLYYPIKDLDIAVSYQRNASSFDVAFGGSGPFVSRLQVGVTYRFD